MNGNLHRKFSRKITILNAEITEHKRIYTAFEEEERPAHLLDEIEQKLSSLNDRKAAYELYVSAMNNSFDQLPVSILKQMYSYD